MFFGWRELDNSEVYEDVNGASADFGVGFLPCPTLRKSTEVECRSQKDLGASGLNLKRLYNEPFHKAFNMTRSVAKLRLSWAPSNE